MLRENVPFRDIRRPRSDPPSVRPSGRPWTSVEGLQVVTFDQGSKIFNHLMKRRSSTSWSSSIGSGLKCRTSLRSSRIPFRRR
jgi:hypothetical protein